MPKNFVRKIFDHWVRNNRYRFQHTPHVIKSRKNGFVFQFTGVAPQLQGHINKWGNFEIMVYFQGKFWDIVTEFDVFPCRTIQGQYYCSACKDAYEKGIAKEVPLLCTSRQELWVQHSFEPFLQWANENLQSSHRLCLGEAKGESTWASIKTLKDAETGGWSFILPIIRSKNR